MCRILRVTALVHSVRYTDINLKRISINEHSKDGISGIIGIRL